MPGEGFGGLACDGVGIGIEDMPLSVVGERSHHGCDALTDKGRQFVAVGTVHIAHKSVVNVFHRALVRPDDIHVGSGQSQGIDAP